MTINKIIVIAFMIVFASIGFLLISSEKTIPEIETPIDPRVEIETLAPEKAPRESKEAETLAAQEEKRVQRELEKQQRESDRLEAQADYKAKKEAEKPIKPVVKSKKEFYEKRDCHPSYPDFCIPSSPPDLDCGDIAQKRFTVLQPDPHRFDGNKDGIGCQ